MNRQEKIIVGILAALLIGLMYKGNIDAQKRAAWEKEHQPVAAESANAPTATPAGSATPAPAAIVASAPADTNNIPVVEAVVISTLPEQTATISNTVMVVTLTSKGGGIKNAELLKHNQSLNPDDGKVNLDFASSPSLALSGIPGLGATDDFDIEVSPYGSATITATTASGLRFTREITLGDGSAMQTYAIAVRDSFANNGDAALTLDAGKIGLGPMRLISSGATDADLAIDLRGREHGRIHTPEIAKAAKGGMFSCMKAPDGPNLAALFGGAAGGGCAAATVSPTAPVRASNTELGEIHWVAAREKYFVQILMPTTPSPALRYSAERDPAAGDALTVKEVSAALALPLGETVGAGETASAEYKLYIGPRKMSELRAFGEGCGEIMRFGTFALFCRLLLNVLNYIHMVVPNYGVAIILLTLIVRLLLYPINRKTTESMKRMKEAQPLLKEAQEKYKEDPKKLQQETMRIYRENKVNPLASCWPLLIQMPILIALFNVLRSSIELRYESFLWIADLSTQEGLFRETLASLGVPFALNILPIVMCATMALQTKLTPTAGGDPSQQKMMAVMMPAMMLFMFYQMASALVLYWTVSQLFAIFGLLRNNYRDKMGKRGANGFTPEPPRETRQMRRERERSMRDAQ